MEKKLHRGSHSAKDPTSRRKAASAADILGTSVSEQKKVPTKWREFYTRLTEIREGLMNEREHLTKDVREELPQFSEHMADAGTDTYDRDWALSMLSSERHAIYEIDEALNRIYAGNYGICEVTSKPIEVERLHAIPWTRFSAAAATELEKNGNIDRPRLGDLRSVNEPEDRAEAADDSDEES